MLVVSAPHSALRTGEHCEIAGISVVSEFVAGFCVARMAFPNDRSPCGVVMRAYQVGGTDATRPLALVETGMQVHLSIQPKSLPSIAVPHGPEQPAWPVRPPRRFRSRDGVPFNLRPHRPPMYSREGLAA